MSQQSYFSPRFEADAFNCPLCNVYAHQQWIKFYRSAVVGYYTVDDVITSRCAHCSEESFWVHGNLVYPRAITAPRAHKDMPDDIREFYDEAREVSAFSPRSAAALLRIVAKKICERHGEYDKNLNKAINKLSEKGLPKEVIDSLHAVRITGNEGGAHEGQIDLTDKDNGEMVNVLFELVNIIVEKTISDPKKIRKFVEFLPESKTQNIPEG